jgi:hypothetical protein
MRPRLTHFLCRKMQAEYANETLHPVAAEVRSCRTSRRASRPVEFGGLAEGLTIRAMATRMTICIDWKAAFGQRFIRADDEPG